MPNTNLGFNNSCKLNTKILVMRFFLVIFFLFSIKAATSQVLQDTSFEAGVNTPWIQSSTNFSYLICNSNCGNCGGQCVANSGNFWAWLGGSSSNPETSIIKQSFTLPSSPGASHFLSFYLKNPFVAANVDDYLSVLIDSTQVFFINSADSIEYKDDYIQVNVDISQFKDGQSHALVFKGYQTGIPGVTNYLIDDVSITSSSSVEESEINKHLVIAPNPIERGNEFKIMISGISGKFELKISSLDGRLVHEEVINTRESNIIKCDFKSGVYIINISDKESTFLVEKLVVK